MWFTHSKKTSMERFSVLSWWATSVQREVTTHLVRHICHTHIHWHTQAPIFVSLFQISLAHTHSVLSDFFSACLHLCLVSFRNRSPYYGHQQWHRGGQGQAGAPRASQTKRRQLLHQCSYLVFSCAPHHCIHVTDYYEWSLTAGCDCSSALTHQRNHTFLYTHRCVCVCTH